MSVLFALWGNNMEILVICPAHVATGGTEALHEFVSLMNAQHGVNARIWYWSIQHDNPSPPEFAAYNCEYVTSMPEGYNDVIVVPEIWANNVMDFPNCTRVIYWLGVDAYAGWTPEAKRGAFLEDESIIHIAQSEYANDFLKKLGAKHIIRCTDTLNPEFYEPYEETERGDVVLYNPAKSTAFSKLLITECKGVKFRPIQNMKRQEVIDAMRHSKLYVDFGEFPGRERMPREAVLCGCCIITSKIGSAGYDADFPHNYKFESKASHLWAIERKIKNVLANYDICRRNFDFFRQALRNEKEFAEHRHLIVAEILEILRNEIQCDSTSV